MSVFQQLTKSTLLLSITLCTVNPRVHAGLLAVNCPAEQWRPGSPWGMWLWWRTRSTTTLTTLCPAWYSSIRFPPSVLLATLLSNLRYFDLSIHPVRQAPGQRKTTAPRRHCTHWDSVGGEKGGQGAAIMRLRRSAQEVEESDKRPTVSGQWRVEQGLCWCALAWYLPKTGGRQERSERFETSQTRHSQRRCVPPG